MEHDERDDLWELLGKTDPPKVSPFFARNVVRAVRLEDRGRAPAWVAWVFRQWRTAGLAAAAAALAIAAVLSMFDPVEVPDGLAFDETVPETLDDPGQTAALDFDIIINLDALLASEENSIWLSDSTSY